MAAPGHCHRAWVPVEDPRLLYEMLAPRTRPPRPRQAPFLLSESASKQILEGHHPHQQQQTENAQYSVAASKPLGVSGEILHLQGQEAVLHGPQHVLHDSRPLTSGK